MRILTGAAAAGAAALVGVLFSASNNGAVSQAVYEVSTDPNVVVLSVEIKDLVAPGSWQYDLFGDGWFRARGETLGSSRGPSSSGIVLGRAEVEAAFADLVNFGVAEADLARIRQEVEPTEGVLPDGRRFYVGVSEPGAGCSISATFDSVTIRGELVRAHTIRFALEPLATYRAKRPDIQALEGIGRVGDRVRSWLRELQAVSKDPRE